MPEGDDPFLIEYRKNYTEIDLSIIAKNVRTVCSGLPDHIHKLAVVKADAYGHGAVPVAETALSAGADFLGVAIPEEGEELRHAGINAPILVLGEVNCRGAEASVLEGLTQTVCDADDVKVLGEFCRLHGRTVDVHLKLDTGMGRIGARTEDEVLRVLDALAEEPSVKLTGAFTHFADADGVSEDYTIRQIERFEKLTELLPGNIIRHAGASSGIIRFPQAYYDMVRIGIVMYGYYPFGSGTELEPALSWYTEVAYVKEISAGECLSYGCTFRSSDKMKVATLAVGYGDGYFRAFSGKAEVLIGGRRCPVIGRICMDQMLVDVTEAKRVQKGDRAVLIGRDGNERIDAGELAALIGTIPYEILLAPSRRVPKQYIY